MINRNEKGSSALEFALVVVLFLTLLFSIVEYALMSYIHLTMQHAVREGTRYAVTGRQDMAYNTYDVTDTETHWLEDDRFNAMVEKIHSQSMGFFDKVLDPEDIVVTDVNGNDTQDHNWSTDYDTNGNGVEDPGEGNDYYYPGDPGNIIVVKLNCTWHLLTPFLKLFFTNGEYNFTVSSTMRNEKFDPGP